MALTSRRCNTEDETLNLAGCQRRRALFLLWLFLRGRVDYFVVRLTSVIQSLYSISFKNGSDLLIFLFFSAGWKRLVIDLYLIFWFFFLHLLYRVNHSLFYYFIRFFILFSFSIQFFVIFGSPYSACVVCRAMGAARIVSSLLSLYPSPFLIALSTVQSRRTESRYFSLPSFDLFICLVCLFVIFFPPPVLFSFLFWLFSRCFCSRQSPVCLFPIVAFCQKNRKIEKGKNNERGETKKIGEKNRRREKRKKRRDKARDTHDWSRSQFKTSAICGQLFVR